MAAEDVVLAALGAADVVVAADVVGAAACKIRPTSPTIGMLMKRTRMIDQTRIRMEAETIPPSRV
jgi:hypothetical protein